MSKTIRLDQPMLIGMILDHEFEDWFVEKVKPDPEAVWVTHYWDDRPHIRPSSWLVTIRPATPAEVEEENRIYDRIKQQTPPLPWWKRVFA